MSTDYRRWFLINASPDIRTQIEAFPALRPTGGRATPVQAVLLTDAELDHTLGLLLLREARTIELHATPAVRDALRDGSSLLSTLESYCDVKWQPVQLQQDVSLGAGLSYRAFDVPTTKPARFGSDAEQGRVVGYRLTDERTGRTAVYLPGAQSLTATVLEMLGEAECLLIDGTCWHDDELIRLGLSGKTARSMGHQPIDGPDGSLAHLSALPIERKIYIHINNTNPVLMADSHERGVLDQRGIEVATDGLEVEV